MSKYKSATIGTGDLRNKLMNRFKSTQEIELERQKNRVKKVRNSGILGLALKGGRSRSPSVNTISSDDSVFNAGGSKKKKKKKLKKRHDGESTTSSSDDDGLFTVCGAQTCCRLINFSIFCRCFSETFHWYDCSARCFSYV